MAAKQRLPKGIRQRGDKFFVDVTVNGIRKTATCDTLAAAVIEQEALRTGIVARQNNLQVEAWTLGEAIKTTVKHKWANGRSLRSHTVNATQIEAFFGTNTLLSDIDTVLIDTFVDDCIAKGNSDATINRKLATLSKVMSTAIERKGLASKPHFPRRDEHEGRIRWLTDEEEALVLNTLTAWSKEEERDAVTVLVDTGMRVSELLNLTARDFDRRTGMVTVWENKANHPRSIPLTVRSRAIVEARAKVRPTGTLFTVKYQALRHVWDSVKGHIGLHADDQFVLHALRHTFASRLVQRGVNLKTVQQLMGHKTLTMTMRYSHLSPQNLVDAIALLDRDAAPAAQLVGSA